MPLIDYRY